MCRIMYIYRMDPYAMRHHHIFKSPSRGTSVARCPYFLSRQGKSWSLDHYYTPTLHNLAWRQLLPHVAWPLPSSLSLPLSLSPLTPSLSLYRSLSLLSLFLPHPLSPFLLLLSLFLSSVIFPRFSLSILSSPSPFLALSLFTFCFLLSLYLSPPSFFMFSSPFLSLLSFLLLKFKFTFKKALLTSQDHLCCQSIYTRNE